MTRKIEFIISLVGGLGVLVFFGGFSMVMKQLSLDKFTTQIYPALDVATSAESYFETLKEMSAWLSVTTIIVLILIAGAYFCLLGSKHVKVASVFYILAGVVTLIGSQFLGLLFALFFFTSGLMCLFKKV